MYLTDYVYWKLEDKSYAPSFKLVEGKSEVCRDPGETRAGETQQANLGTKPFTKEKLKQLVALWGWLTRDQLRKSEFEGSTGPLLASKASSMVPSLWSSRG